MSDSTSMPDSPPATGLSLRTRLIALLLTGLVVVWIVALVVSYFEAHHELDELLDARLKENARTLMALDLRQLRVRGSAQSTNGSTEHERERDQSDQHNKAGSHDDADDDDTDDGGADHRIDFQVWNWSGQLLARSPRAPLANYVADAGYREMRLGDTTWQTFALWDRMAEYQVRVFDDELRRRALTQEIVTRLGLPLAVSLPLLLLLAWVAIGRGLAPLRLLSRTVAARDANRLLPLEMADAPREVQPLVHAINSLLARLSHSLEAERRFTADAAHELRTPLAGIRAQAQVALASEDEAARTHALQMIMEGTDRATRLAAQLLTLARADRGSALPMQPVDLDALVRRCVARYAGAALEQDLEMELITHGPCSVRGEPELLDALCANLVENAIHYTPSGGHVEIEIRVLANTTELRVADDGPGVTPEHRLRVLDRFYRVPGNTHAGSGLGLSIVQRIAQLHGAEVQLGDGLQARGLGVTVRFPAASGRRV